MKKIIFLFFIFLIINSASYAALTVNNIPKARTGGVLPTLQNSSMTEVGGNVGVGITSPAQKLDVNGTVRAIGFSGNGSGLTAIPASQISGVIPIGNLANGTPNGDKFLRDDGLLAVPPGSLSNPLWETNLVGIDTFSPIGVGSTTPGQALDVKGTVRATAFVGDGSGITGISGSIAGLTTNKLSKAGSSTTIVDSQIFDNGTNVGVGSLTPGQKLDVNGTIRAVNFTGSGSGLLNTGTFSTFTVCASDKTASYKCDYSATGTNDQTQINLAIIAAHALTTGGRVFLTEGHFFIGNNGTSIVPYSNVWLQGSGMYGITILVSNRGLGGNGTVENYNGINSGFQVNNFRISDLKIDGSDQKNNVAWSVQQKGIAIGDGTVGYDDNIMVDHTWIYNTAATCIATDSGTNQIITHNLMDSCGTTGQATSGGNGYPLGNNGYGYGTINSGIDENITVSNNICKNIADVCILFEEQASVTTASWGYSITGNVDYGSYNTVRLSGNSGATISNNISYNSVNSSYVATTDTFANISFKDIIFSNNYSLNSGADGITVSPNTSTTGTNIILSNNIIDTCTGFGIHNFSSGVLINGNFIKNCGQDGIYALAGLNVTDLKIVNNVIKSNGTASIASHKSGINIKINSTFTWSNIDIEGNQISSNPDYAIDTELSAGAFSNFILKNNDLTGNSTGVLNSTLLIPNSNFFPFGNRGYTTNIIEGNVGIGSSSPGQRLDIQGTVRAIAFIGDGSQITGLSGSISGLTTNVFPLATSSTTIGDSIIRQISSNIGIGSTVPGQKLDIQGTVRAIALSILGGSSSAFLKANGSTDSTSYLSVNPSLDTVLGIGNTSTRAITVGTVSVNNNLLVIGNIGINSTTPGQLLDVQGTIRTSQSVIVGSGMATITGDVNGNVGIGSIHPGQALDINGSIRAIGIGTSVPQEICRKSDGTFGYFNGAWSSTCN